MNKTDLVRAISAKSGLSKKDSEVALNAFVDAVQEALLNNEKIVLVNFGTFEVRNRAARKGRNPQTKTEIMIPASKTPVFKAGKGFKDKINS
ncbi:MAG TPA: integration host factor subunit alpha [Clostridiales bacterium]|nr:integration host factor subunit alpha [Clostridiales bacterium]